MASDVDGPTAEAAVYVAASPERVWALVSDIHLIASLSAEVQDVTWLDGATEAAPGARFRGRNRHRAALTQLAEPDLSPPTRRGS